MKYDTHKSLYSTPNARIYAFLPSTKIKTKSFEKILTAFKERR